jgi:MFS transporter, FSR family, fosmidomycin resistance protein
MQTNKPFRVAPFISLYAFAHLAVDAACAYLLLGLLDLGDHVISGLLVYNGFAFVLQAPFGYFVDKFLNPKLAAITGLALVAVSFLFSKNVYPALIIMSLGNALYHVGGGSLVLSIRKKKATYAGLFVAPGAIGLAIGSYLAVSPTFVSMVSFPVLLTILGVALYFVGKPVFERSYEKIKTGNWGILLVFLIMIPIVVRSLIGMSVSFPWKENVYLGLALTASLALGKVFGGILADRFGLVKIGVSGLLIAAPLLAFFPHIPFWGIVGAFVFNFTMPVTLIAILNILPGKRGLSFGLASTALFLGALPVILDWHEWIKGNGVIFSLILISSFILFAALSLRNKTKPT